MNEIAGLIYNSAVEVFSYQFSSAALYFLTI